MKVLDIAPNKMHSNGTNSGGITSKEEGGEEEQLEEKVVNDIEGTGVFAIISLII